MNNCVIITLYYIKQEIAVKDKFLIECYAEIKYAYLYLQSDMVPQYVGHHHHLGISASHYEPRSQQATSLRIPIISLVNRSKLKSIKGRALS
jgi:hypothetical protein